MTLKITNLRNVLIGIILSAFMFQNLLNAQSTFGTEQFISTERKRGSFTISADGFSVPLIISSKEWPGVSRAFMALRKDIENVTLSLPEFYTDKLPASKEIIIAGTIGKSPLIDQLIKNRKIEKNKIEGKWETFIIQVVNRPFKGVKKALVIAGSDKRGTIYGIYEISRQIGVSPWYWWADVPVAKEKNLFAKPFTYIEGPPSVKYRGIFLNDEAPDLTNWIRAKYGSVPLSDDPPIPPGVANYGREFYTRLFELLLRLKANYLWPAMWNNAFNEDDPENPRLADEYGIVMGNSHQEPMLRAQKEWDRRYQKKLGSWNYAKNPDVLESFWREGLRRNNRFESIITIGLRGANDTPMAPGGPEANMTLLEKIVNVQRRIIAEEINPDVTKVPQLWCLYKEVQEYYNAGMRVPDDVTLLWAEDNWGNIRRLPGADERKRSGGAGIYYHFDYHGGPRSYQWLNTNPIPKIWDQMSLAKQYGADRIWIVNVGHFKGYELPMEYFLDLAWNTDRLTNENISEYTRHWAAREFGEEYSAEIAKIVSHYTRYNGRRKPELLAPDTYSLVNYNEAEKIANDFTKLALEAENIFNKLSSERRDAFYQLVLFPVKACAIVNELYLAAGKNILYAHQGRSSTNDMAEQVHHLFQADTSLMGYFNRVFANGKWNHFMDQSHLGYTDWADPPSNSLRAIKLKEIIVTADAEPGVSIEGSEAVWPGENISPLLPDFDVFNRQTHYIDVFNKGKGDLVYTTTTDKPWITVDRIKGPFNMDDRLLVTIDWQNLPQGRNKGNLTISAAGRDVSIGISAFKPDEITAENLKGFIEGEGVVSVEAEHFTNNIPAGDASWIRIEEYGHTLSAMRASAPPDFPAVTPGNNSPCLEYRMYLFSTGNVDVRAVFAPTLNFIHGRGQKYGISFDDQLPQTVTLVPEDYDARNGNQDWEKTVRDNSIASLTKHTLLSPGYHTLKIWMVDPGPVIQKIIVNTGGLRKSYLGPPESFRSK
ncbi:MAG TPA: glycosyl hydrolase [Bacteroidales bacterium]|nr:glycosyl hydrolase [Bacteroidales bacterium]